MIGQIPARCMSATSLGPVCDQDSVKEFGLDQRKSVMNEARSRTVTAAASDDDMTDIVRSFEVD